MNKKSHILMLLAASFLWGTTFVAQSIGADYVGAWTYLAGRSWVAVVFLTPIIPFMDRIADLRGTESRRPKTAADRKLLLAAGLACGTMLCAASVAQQHGMGYTSASKAGFITALYVVFVPILSIFVRRRPPVHVWICVLVSLVGLYLLCMTSERISLEIGDSFVLASALFFSFQILILDHFSPLVDGVRLSRVQFLVVAVISTVFMLLVDRPDMAAIRSALPAILYAGIFSSGIAYTFQILGQDGVNPSLASLIMSLESVFSALSGWAVLGERLSPRELLGSALMFLSILFAQIDLRPRKKPGA